MFEANTIGGRSSDRVAGAGTHSRPSRAVTVTVQRAIFSQFADSSEDICQDIHEFAPG
jgi:hypothetical protein